MDPGYGWGQVQARSMVTDSADRLRQDHLECTGFAFFPLLSLVQFSLSINQVFFTSLNRLE